MMSTCPSFADSRLPTANACHHPAITVTSICRRGTQGLTAIAIHGEDDRASLTAASIHRRGPQGLTTIFMHRRGPQGLAHCSIHTEDHRALLTTASIHRRGPQDLTHCSIYTQERTAGPYYRQGCGELLLHTISATPSVEWSISACLRVCGYGVHKDSWRAPGV